MQDVGRRLIASALGLVVVCLLVAGLGVLLIGIIAALLSNATSIAPLAADTPTPFLACTPMPAPRPTPTATAALPPVVLVLDSASGGSTANEPCFYHYTFSISTSPSRPNVVANFSVSYCGQVRYHAGSYLDASGHATFHDNVIVPCSAPFTVTLTGESLTQEPGPDERLGGSVSFTVPS